MQTNFNKSNKIFTFSPQQRFFIAFLLVLIAVLGRTVFHLGDNIELVTSVSLLSAAYLGFIYALAVPFFTMLISDLIIKNTNIFLFTWSSYLISGILGYILLSGRENSGVFYLRSTIVGILSSIFFYLWTNFGVWALDSFGMYRNNLNGLIDSYIMGIPFFKSNLLGNLFIVPIVFIIFNLAFYTLPDKTTKKNFWLFK